MFVYTCFVIIIGINCTREGTQCLGLFEENESVQVGFHMILSKMKLKYHKCYRMQTSDCAKSV